MPPIRRPDQQQTGADPVQRLAQLRYQRALLAASIPDDETFASLQEARAASEAADRAAARNRLVALDEQIAALEPEQV
jgi:hypothetical protein